jgi:hypothetical protein
MLSRDEILKLTPDELNRAIWTAQGHPLAERKIRVERYRDSPIEITRVIDAVSRLEMPKYARSIEAAWELVENVQGEPHEQFVQIDRAVAIARRWHCTLGRISASGDTAPMAISRCWLLWHNEVV